MSSKPIRVGVIEADKDATACFRNPTSSKPGAEIEIIQMVFHLMNQPFELIDVSAVYNVTVDLGELIVEQVEGGGANRIISSSGITGRTGGADMQGEFTRQRKWSGMMGLITNDLIDMSGISMRITEERSKDVLFSYPTRFFQSILIIATPSDLSPRSFLFSAFSSLAWIVLIAVLLAAFALQIGHVLVRRSVLGRHSCDPRSIVLILLLAMNRTFSAPKRAPLLSHALYVSIFILSLFIITQLYQSMMFSVLASPTRVSLPFTNMHGALDAAESGSFFFSAYERQALLCSNGHSCQRIDELIAKGKIVRRTTEGDITNDLNHGGIYQATIDGEFLKDDLSWLDERTRIQIAMKDGSGAKHYGAFAFIKKNKQLKKRFDRALGLLYSSIAKITTGHGYHTRKEPMDKYLENSWFALEWFHLREAFVVLLFAHLAATVCFAVEVLLHLLLTRFCSSTRRCSRRTVIPRIVIIPSDSDDRRLSTVSTVSNPFLSLMSSIQFKPTRRESFVP
ncbi:hypothetical protein PRIPAC_72172 [Pristionchus pacificus]|uniref:PBPb domain-containing protein n=1 Tax=Pristionchus pacificus TaxID=54126 RepID=A0A2A6CEL7_PRIPA|nr:hypothetical protein PRIPAC_72172 [Pristionchus pacificus]|eukprot:PDM76644.1 hypothetical protein PRIPAC_42039 [Pristionchus pacificus]